MSIQISPLLNLPWPAFRQIIDTVASLHDPHALSVALHLRRVCKQFDHELSNAIFAHKSAQIRKDSADVAHILPLMRRKLFERAAAGTLDDSDFKNAIDAVGHSLQCDHGALQGLDQMAIFRDLFDAAIFYSGPNEAVSKLLNRVPSVLDSAQLKEQTLVVAAYLGETALVQSLLDQGADPNALSNYFGFALSAAAREGHFSTVNILLDGGADSHTSGRFEDDAHFTDTAIVAAASACHEDIIRLLMEPEYKHPTSGKAYHRAIMTLADGKHVASVLFLLERATFDVDENLPEEILLAASANGCLPLVEAMVDRGVALNGSLDEFGDQCALQLAAYGGHEDVISYLLAKGTLQDGFFRGNDPITAAAAQGHVGSIKLLLQHGADINSRHGYRGTTPLREAARNNHVDAVRFLLDKAAKTEVQQDGMTIYLGHKAVVKAIKKGHKEIVQAFAEGGLDVTRVAPDCTESDPPPIVLAKMWGHDDIVMLLLELGAENADPLKTRWAEDFRRGVYPKSSWTLRSRRTG
ncbi:MAG: hypothetical protein HETSPECPRED_007368 [Heterodermia speciosa]|uniref:F-box domain-containing protein n=1 Tax=Heterodermia speciosa TaxID=116794 RepID=A0A8H3PJS8_9LECA|nr:MAG: hypothetical protein HETSPECPRED_007368 [Heterodermia speciosa]